MHAVYVTDSCPRSPVIARGCTYGKLHTCRALKALLRFVAGSKLLIRQLWPIAEGSLSLRKSKCIRKNCSACNSGRGHACYVLSGRRGSRRFSIYVPDELGPNIQQAINNGRQLQELMNEAGVRLVNALKNRRKERHRE